MVPFLPEELPNEAEWDQYKLLCPDNTWKPVTEYKECHLAQIPSRAVVAHVRSEKDSAIWELLHLSQVYPHTVPLTFLGLGVGRASLSQTSAVERV